MNSGVKTHCWYIRQCFFLPHITITLFLTVSTEVFTRMLKKHNIQHPVYILNSRPSQRTLSNTPNLTRHDERIFKKMNKHQALGTITDLLLCFCTEACNWAVGGETNRRSPVCFSRPTFCQLREGCSCSNDSGRQWELKLHTQKKFFVQLSLN